MGSIIMVYCFLTCGVRNCTITYTVCARLLLMKSERESYKLFPSQILKALINVHASIYLSPLPHTHAHRWN